MKFRRDNPNQNTLLEYDNSHKAQGNANKATKRNFLSLVKSTGCEYLITSDLTVHHIDDAWQNNNLKDNSFDNVLFINATTKEANTLHQVLHFCKAYNKNVVGFVRALWDLTHLPIYFYDTKEDKVKRISFYEAFKK